MPPKKAKKKARKASRKAASRATAVKKARASKKKAAPRKTARKKTAARKKTTVKKTAKRTAAPKRKAAGKKVAPKKKAAPKKAAGKKTAPSKKKAAGKKTAPSKKKAAGKKVAPKKKAAVRKAVPRKAVRAEGAARISKKEEQRFQALRKLLLEKREQISRETQEEISKYIKGENRQLVESALDDGDWSVIDLSEDINLRKLATHRDTLLKIDEALRKIKEGTYGICEECGEEINTDRLRILPFAVYCRDCQEAREELEAAREIRSL
jgi:DnaK suppressor protein